jgi:hypothetical protein
MHIRIIAFLFLLATTTGDAGQCSSDKNNAISYLVRKVLTYGKGSGSVVFVPLQATDIKHNEANRDIKYWSVLERNFPGVSRDSLKRMTDAAPWLDKTMKMQGYTLYYPDVRADKPYNYTELSKKNGNNLVVGISNIIFTNDGNTCIAYITGTGIGSFTIEIKKGPSGKFSYHTLSTDWMD